MALPQPSPLFLQFVDDELLRAPLLYDQLLDAVLDVGRRGLPGLASLQRTTLADLLQAVQSQRDALAELRASRWPTASAEWPAVGARS